MYGRRIANWGYRAALDLVLELALEISDRAPQHLAMTVERRRLTFGSRFRQRELDRAPALGQCALLRGERSPGDCLSGSLGLLILDVLAVKPSCHALQRSRDTLRSGS
jgi:hypothetical protein